MAGGGGVVAVTVAAVTLVAGDVVSTEVVSPMTQWWLTMMPILVDERTQKGSPCVVAGKDVCLYPRDLGSRPG